MSSIAEATRSVWMNALPRAFPHLSENLRTDVVVVGAGITGITTAYLLARAGRSVVLLDSGPPGGGMTCRTTAHLSCALDDRWSELVKLRGDQDARSAAESHVAAIDFIERIQREEDIACDFARVPGYLMLAPGHDASVLDDEYRAA